MQPTPLAWPGGRAPLWVDGPASAQIPELFRSRLQRQWGYPPPGATWPPPTWGIGNENAENEAYDRHTAPSDASEVIRSIDVQRCVTVDPATIATTGTAFELVRITNVPAAAAAVIERVPTMWTATALDDAGNPALVYGRINGERPCLRELVHPDPAVAPLRWSYRITQTHMPTHGAPVTPYLGPIPSLAVPGADIISPWPDMRYGHASTWGDRQQLVVRPETQVRFFVVLSGPADRYRVEVGARLAGYWQLGGRRGAALHGAITRIV